MSHKQRIIKLMRASLKSRNTPKHLKAGLRRTIKKFVKAERNE